MDRVNPATLLALAIAEIHRLSFVIDQYPGVCIYCGDAATTVDHLAAILSSGRHSHTVPACHRCNILLGPFPSVSVRERAAHVEQRELVKNRRLLVGVRHDLDEYGYGLRTALESRESRRELLHARLRNLRVGGIGDSRFRPIED